MAGKNCVAIASDKRLGAQYTTIACDFPKTFKINDHVYLGLAGLQSDVLSLSQLIKFRMNLYELTEERQMKVETFGALVSHMLYVAPRC